MTRTGAAFLYLPEGSGPIPAIEQIGGKARSLARLRELTTAGGFAVPRFLVLTTEAYARQDPELRQAVGQACVAVGWGAAALAVRSSAVVEDSASRSYAGLFESVLGVAFAPGADDDLWEAIQTVWRSASAPRTQIYGAPEGPPAIAVVIQEMVEPLVSGVAFSIDPVSGREDVAIVSAVYGLGQGLVSGELDADSHWVTLQGEVTTRVARKERALRGTAGGGTAWQAVAEAEATRAALSDDEARRIASCARFLADRLEGPQDIEWALVGDAPDRQLVLLQSRPITRLAPPKASAPRHVWDNSNIVESYPGVTSRLTFSFAQSVYEEVYRQFCRLLGVPERTLEEFRPVFARMLGHVRGRVYYDLLNWYRMLALLPGYRLNREFMERMMGVREKLENAPAPPASGSRAADAARLAGTAVRIVAEDVRLAWRVPRFLRRVDGVLAAVEDADLGTWSAAETVACYRRLERELLFNWRIPIMNDFSAMIWFGVLCRLVERWLPELPPSVVNDLLCGETGIRSTEPARRVMRLARAVREDPRLVELLQEGDSETRWARLQADPAQARFVGEVRAYLHEFGDRCIEELKLETIPPRADPARFLDVIAGYERASLFDAEAGREREKAVRASAEREVLARLPWWRRLVFRTVLSRARRRVRDRENLRFERTRVFGAVRRIFVRLGQVMAERGALDAPRDVFSFSVAEVFAFFGGELAADEARTRSHGRRAQFAGFEREPAPPSRFESDDETPPAPLTAPAGPARNGDLAGLGCCPGIVRGPVRVVRDPARPGELSGHILVAERTDPGWTLLFPLASGLLVERGSLLSHSAIVAREIGLPCIVGVQGLIETLVDGEFVEMDGARGTVVRLGRRAEA